MSERNMQPEDLKSQLDQGEDFMLLDVREPTEWDHCRIEGATHIPMREIPQRLDELPRGKRIVCYCHHGGRSRSVQDFLLEQGFDDVINLIGGIDAWSRNVDTSVPQY